MDMEEIVNATIYNFPVQIICLEKLENTLDSVLDDEENKPKNLKSEQSKFIDNVVNNLNENMGIIVSNAGGFIISNCINQLNVKASRSKYNKYKTNLTPLE